MAPNAKSTRRARVIEHTRRDILDAAARVFAEAGFHQATMQAIAREAGFTAASLYTYFGSKDEIYEALLEELKSALLAAFDARVPAGLTFEQRLELLLQRQFELVIARRNAIRIIFDLGPNRPRRKDPNPFDYLERMEAFLASAGADRLRCGADEAARLLFGITHATFLPIILSPPETPFDPARQAERVVDLFLHGALGTSA